MEIVQGSLDVSAGISQYLDEETSLIPNISAATSKSVREKHLLWNELDITDKNINGEKD
jgi:predicted metal-dependent phosphoesterase TrpH